jgi:hypothetical protein
LLPTTIVTLSYGVTLQVGTLGNTWQSVLLSDGTRGDEILPRHRQRHVLSSRLLQWLPWQGALRLAYRAYLDDWGIGAQTIEKNLIQRLFPVVSVRAVTRVHWQTAARFYTISADPRSADFRTADSDLASFRAVTIGGGLAFDLGGAARRLRFVRDVHLDIGYERYVRTNNLGVDITTCGLGFLF